VLESVSGGLEPPTWPLPWRKAYMPFGELVPLWQFVQLPAVPLARYAS
jgi:hypothetical protein